MCKASNYFIESLDLKEHPMIQAKEKVKIEYFMALSYVVHHLVEQVENQMMLSNEANNTDAVLNFYLSNILHPDFLREFTSKRLDMYKSVLCPTLESKLDTSDIRKAQKILKTCLCRPWHKRQRICLMYDVALVMLEENLVKQGASEIKQFLSKRKKEEIDCLVDSLLMEKKIQSGFPQADVLVKQYQKNRSFLSQKEHKLIVTANMSAGKSTLINALIGKSIARTSQEVCTGSVCYIYNKAFEDGHVHLRTKNLTINATESDLHSYTWNNRVSIASHFSGFTDHASRICLIDTPGVDAALHKEHTELTHSALINQKYDFAIYVVSPTNLGTDAEKKHLFWVAQHIPKDHIIFVLNKLDDYRNCSDSIEESISGLRKDLEQAGFENPTICPISAYFGLLLKLKMTGQPLSDDEQDEYAFLSKKFKRSSYDLSRFYEGVELSDSDSEEVMLSKRTGLYGLEKLIYGGLSS